MTNTDDAPADVVLRVTLECAEAWEPGVRLLGNVRAGDMARALQEALTLQATLDFTQDWWAVRAERIRALAEERGCWPEVCNILANGTAGMHEPPTYAQRLNLARHDKAAAHRERESLLDRIAHLERENARLTKELAEKELPAMKVDPAKFYVYQDVLTDGDQGLSGFSEVPEADFRLLWPFANDLTRGNPPSTKRAYAAFERVMSLHTFDLPDAEAEKIPGDHYLCVAVC